MTDRADEHLDKELAAAFSDIRVSEQLKAQTMERIHASAVKSGQESETAARASGSPRGAVFPLPKHRKRFAFGIAAAVLVFALLGVGGHAFYNTETAYAQIGESSKQTVITLRINRFDRVISTQATRGELQDEVDALNLKHMDYASAMETLAASGLLGGENVDAEVNSDDTAQESDLVSITTNCLEGAGHSGTCNGAEYGMHGHGTSGAGNGSEAGEGMHDGSGAGSGSGAGQGMHHGHGSGGVHGNHSEDE